MRERCAIKERADVFASRIPPMPTLSTLLHQGKNKYRKNEGMKNKQKHLRDAMKKRFPQLDYDEKNVKQN